MVNYPIANHGMAEFEKPQSSDDFWERVKKLKIEYLNEFSKLIFTY